MEKLVRLKKDIIVKKSGNNLNNTVWEKDTLMIESGKMPGLFYNLLVSDIYVKLSKDDYNEITNYHKIEICK